MTDTLLPALAISLGAMRSQDWTAVFVVSWIALVGLTLIAVGMNLEEPPDRR